MSQTIIKLLEDTEFHAKMAVVCINGMLAWISCNTSPVIDSLNWFIMNSAMYLSYGATLLVITHQLYKWYKTIQHELRVRKYRKH